MSQHLMGLDFPSLGNRFIKDNFVEFDPTRGKVRMQMMKFYFWEKHFSKLLLNIENYFSF